uniref:Uncharacterized protein n=1 Tax=Vespula pensylvanica TaxID=30213 RepID=A0A834NFE1_VESPE|nr:hypothetical protein H0235_014626 [Vespula pensylvanica]
MIRKIVKIRLYHPWKWQEAEAEEAAEATLLPLSLPIIHYSLPAPAAPPAVLLPPPQLPPPPPPKPPGTNSSISNGTTS